MHAALRIVLVVFALAGCGGRESDEVRAPSGPAGEPPPQARDHRPRHGGVVGMIGQIHVEVVAAPDGRVRAHLTDPWRRPLAVRGVTGTVTLDLPDGPRELRFHEVEDALEARTAPFTAESALAGVSLLRDGQLLEMNVLLDLTGARAGVPIVPRTGCVPPSRAASEGRSPRCTVAFAQAFTAIGTSPDGGRVVVAVSHGATTVWKLPEGVLVMGVDPPPPVSLPRGAPDPDARVVAVRPDGAELLMAFGDRLAVFDAATGRFRRELPGPAGAVAAAAWSPDGGRVLVVAAGDGKAHLLDATDGRIVRTLGVEHQAGAAALDPTGRWAAVATDVGTIAVVDLAGDAAPRVLTPSLQPVEAVAFAGGRLVSAGSDGTLRVFDPAAAVERLRVELGVPLVRLAVAPDGATAAVANHRGAVHLVRLADGERVERLGWHRATIGVLAWGAGGTLVTGDADGALAVWDVGGAVE